MNIGDQIRVSWAGYITQGEAIGFDRGEAVVAFDAMTSEPPGTVRLYGQFDPSIMELDTMAEYSRRMREIAEQERQAHFDDPLSKRRA